MGTDRVIWSPQPRQAALMARFEDEALYGGAAGGGKSDCALAEALRQVHIPYYRGLVLRKTYPQLTELMDRSTEIYRAAYRGAKFNESKHVWTFPSGAKIYFGSMQYTKDRTNYQGKRYDFIDFDELTQFLWDEYSYMFSRNRPNGPGTRCYIRAQANPGGVGHGWVKERFITAGKPMETIWERLKIRHPDGREESRWKSRIFVPSSVFDNKILLQNDPDYLTRLAAMPERERNALLYGDWDTFSGQVFTEWRNDGSHYSDRINTHVIAPFLVPDTWAIWCAMDWGYARPFSVGWYAVDHDRRLYRIREFYGCTGTPNEGLRLEPSDVARRIKKIEGEDPNLRGRTIRRVGDPAIWGSQGSESVGALMERQRVYFEKGDNARLDGKMQVHHRLSFDERGVPMLYVFSTCRHFIRTVPNLVYDEQDVEDVDTGGEDHIYDELRYVCMKNPIAPRPKAAAPLVVYDPLSAGEEEQEYDRYDFYRRY
ncbi:MAG TPA: Terminase-like family protein [Candidatus Galloscillospira stercoripullorum]|nr:Terminase-like family protein [Candidatus Galloscillospira stercoripullorum]